MSIHPVRRGFQSRSASCFSQSPLSECAPVSLPRLRMPRLRPTTLWLRPGGHMSHSESYLSRYLLIGLHLRYPGRVSLTTLISPYGFGLVGFRVWLMVRTTRPDGPMTSRGFCLTLLVADFRSSRSFLDLFRSVRSLPLCSSAPLSRVLPRFQRISASSSGICGLSCCSFCVSSSSPSMSPASLYNSLVLSYVASDLVPARSN